MEINPSDIVLNIISILILFALLRMILWKPIYKFLSARSEAVAEKLRNAEETEKNALALEAEYNEKLEGAKEEGRRLIREQHVRAEDEAKSIISDAKTRSDAILEDARTKIEAEKAISVARARDEVAQLATDMAARILKREISPETTRAVAEDFFREAK